MNYDRLGKWFLIACAAGFVGSLILIALPTKLKHYRIHRVVTDYGKLIVVTFTEHGFGSAGMVSGHHSILYQGSIPSQLDAIRQEWKLEQARPPVSTIDTSQLMWDGWGPSCTNRPDGVGVAELGEYLCVPYLVLAIGFGLPLLWRAARWTLLSFRASDGLANTSSRTGR